MLQLSSVAVHVAHAVLVNIQRQAVIVLQKQWRQGIAHLHQEACGAENLAAHLHLAGLDFRQVQDVVNQREQLLAREDDRREVMMKLLAIDLHAISQLVLKHLRVTDDGIERRSQFVTDIGEEHTFGGTG